MQVGYRLEDKLVETVKEMAAQENRSVSNMVEVLLGEAVKARQPSKPKK